MDGERMALHPSLAMLVCLLSLLPLAGAHRSISEARRAPVTVEQGGNALRKDARKTEWDDVGPDLSVECPTLMVLSPGDGVRAPRLAWQSPDSPHGTSEGAGFSLKSVTGRGGYQERHLPSRTCGPAVPTAVLPRCERTLFEPCFAEAFQAPP